MQTCPATYVCAPLSRADIAATFGGISSVSVGGVGVCAYAPQGIMLPEPGVVPPPL